MPVLLTLFFSFSFHFVYSQQQQAIKMLEFSAANIPSKYYKGKIVTGKQWQDGNGMNIVIQTAEQVKLKASQPEEAETRHSLCAYHFIKTDTAWKQVFRVIDGVDDCGLDVRAGFIKNSLSITDLDKDGVPEISFAYALSCKGDVSPDELKFILYEGTQKYIIRGQTTLIINKQKTGGKKVIDKSFTDGPKQFLDFANGQWSKFGTERF
jgi:hypothetical protein